jgi:ubiquitin carboxyl-terminal hydrolase 10
LAEPPCIAPELMNSIEFLREFTPSPGSGSSTPSEKAKPVGAAYKGKAKDNKKYAGADAFIPENVYEALKGLSRFDALRVSRILSHAIGTDFQRGQQEDAQEFLGWFIETLHEELLRIVSRTESSRSTSATRPADGDASEIARPVSPSDGWLEVGKKQKTNVVRNTETRESAVTRMFGGTLRSILHAPGQKDSVTLEPYQPIQLDIQSPNVKSITDALRQFNEPEPVPEYRSSKGVVAATKQVFIETFPPVLILHLKRFVYDHVAHDSVKKNKPIAYGTELVIPQEIISPTKRSGSAVKYRLFGGTSMLSLR